MDKKERYERESKAKGGSVPPDLRRESHHKEVHTGAEANVDQDTQRKLQREHQREIERREGP